MDEQELDRLILDLPWDRKLALARQLLEDIAEELSQDDPPGEEDGDLVVPLAGAIEALRTLEQSIG